MDKLELKHLAPYLPYGLKVFVESDGFLQNDEYLEINGITHNGVNVSTKTFPFNTDYCFDDFKPILRPLSDLTKEIGHNGGRIICLFDKYQDLGRDLTDIIDDERWAWEYPYHIVCDFLSHHFDVFGLIEKGLAIDINILE